MGTIISQLHRCKSLKDESSLQSKLSVMGMIQCTAKCTFKVFFPTRHTWAWGGVRGGDAHRLTPQNIVPLPKAKFDPPNREKLKFSVATPSLSPKNRINIGRFFFSCFERNFSSNCQLQT